MRDAGVRQRPRGLRFRRGRREVRKARALCPDVQGPGERVGVGALGQDPSCHVTSTCTAAWGVVRRFWTRPRQQSMQIHRYLGFETANLRSVCPTFGRLSTSARPLPEHHERDADHRGDRAEDRVDGGQQPRGRIRAELDPDGDQEIGRAHV